MALTDRIDQLVDQQNRLEAVHTMIGDSLHSGDFAGALIGLDILRDALQGTTTLVVRCDECLRPLAAADADLHDGRCDRCRVGPPEIRFESDPGPTSG